MFPRRAFRLYPRTNHRVPHISLVFREIWDTTDLPFKPVKALTSSHWQNCGEAHQNPAKPLSHCTPAGLRLARGFADPVEIHSCSLDAVHPSHHCP
jgi:hypothetical protein